MSLCTYGLLACSSFDAQPCELKLLHAAIKGGKVTKAGEPWRGLDLPLCVCSPAVACQVTSTMPSLQRSACHAA